MDMFILLASLSVIGFGGVIGWATIYVILELRKDGIKITEFSIVRYFGYAIGYILLLLAILGMFICAG